ncbi:protein TIFY 10A-like [Hibiscus syriacus]|uniref:protein TIFY 10A-like n=1 Tax=Hibiscus syriacus TaxID=106335 RepID=UPI00192210A6|nr:protein TIFY 10A-like [Hibiscus syriacus]
MSCSPEFMGRKPVQSPEKSSFAQTCSLLSQYLKEKGSFGDLNLGMTCNVEADGRTMNLFPVNEKSGDDCVLNVVAATRKPRSMDFFPNQAGFPSPDDGPKRVDSSIAALNNPAMTTEPQTAQMTIFYGGQMIVFNDFPADKANEIMLLAGNTVTQDCLRSAQPPIPAGGKPNSPLRGSHLPIARRASLHRFLAKRKDR